MAGFVPNAWAARLIEATTGKTAITTATMYLGLATALPDDSLTTTLANLTECATPGYARIAVPTFGSATTVAPIKQTTPTAFQFAAFTADATIAVTHAFLTTAASGTGSEVRYVFSLEEPILGRNGEPLIIPASTLIIE